jgi:hypothetical protein
LETVVYDPVQLPLKDPARAMMFGGGGGGGMSDY